MKKSIHRFVNSYIPRWKIVLAFVAVLCITIVISEIFSNCSTTKRERILPTLLDPDRIEKILSDFITSTNRNTTTVTHTSDRHKMETTMRSILENILGFPLPKCRPHWLVNPITKRRLELNMYNEKHAIAFEYDGAQHSFYTPHWHKNEAHFEYRRLLYKLKSELCHQNGVNLIRIPWQMFNHIPVPDTHQIHKILLHVPHDNTITALQSEGQSFQLHPLQGSHTAVI